MKQCIYMIVAGAAPSKGRVTSAAVISPGGAAVAGDGTCEVVNVHDVKEKIMSANTLKDFFMFPLVAA